MLIAGCGGGGEDAAKVPVTVAFGPLQEAAQRIGGDRVDVTNLTPVGGQPHGLVPSPEATTALRRAKVVLHLGAAFQPAVVDAASRLPATVKVVDLGGGTQALTIPKPVDGMKGAVEAGTAGDPDPHTWVDPARFRAMAAKIGETLTAADPDGREEYEARSRKYLAELDALDGEVTQGLAGCKSAVLLVTHPAYGYLAERLGLQQAVTAGITPGGRPSAANLRALAAFAKRSKATTLFFTSSPPARLAAQIEATTGLATDALNPFEGLTQDQAAAGAGYASILRDDLARLQRGLGCTAT